MGTWLGPAGRHVNPFFQHSRRHHVGFVRELAKEDAVEDAVGHVGLFSVAEMAGAQRFLIHPRASNRHFLNPLLALRSQARHFAMSIFGERLRTLRIG